MLSCSNTKASKQIHQSLKIVAKIHMSTDENLEHYVQAKIHNCQNLYQNKQLQSTTSRMTRLLKYVREQTKKCPDRHPCGDRMNKLKCADRHPHGDRVNNGPG